MVMGGFWFRSSAVESFGEHLGDLDFQARAQRGVGKKKTAFRTQIKSLAFLPRHYPPLQAMVHPPEWN